MFGRRRFSPPPPPAPVKRAASPLKPAASPIKPAAFIQPETPPPSAQNMDRMQQQMNAQKAAQDQFNASRDNLMNMRQAGQLSAQDMDRMQQQMDADRMQQQMDAQRGGLKSGGKVGSASKRADGIAQRGKTKGRYI